MTPARLFPITLLISLGVSRDAVSQTCTGNIAGDAGDSMRSGTEKGDIFCGFGGNDLIMARAGNDLILPGPGVDWVIGDSGNEPFNRCLGRPAIQPDSRGVAIAAGSGDTSPGGHARRGPPHGAHARSRSFDVFEGGAGFDALNGRSGDDAILYQDSHGPFYPGRSGRASSASRPSTEVAAMTSSICVR